MVPIIDLHEDIAFHLMFEGGPDFDIDAPNRQSDIPKLLKANTRLVFASIFPIHPTYNPSVSSYLASGYGTSLEKAYVPIMVKSMAIEMIKVYYSLTKRFSDNLSIVETKEQAEEAINNRDKVGLLLSFEGSEALEDIYDLEVFHRLGVRALGITWNFDNRYGASCLTKKDYGLTSDGEELIRLANKLGIIIDLAHVSKRTMIDALTISKKPVIISHANSAFIYQHRRNVDDDVLELLKRNGGIIGITMIPSTIGPKPNLESLINHIVHIHQTFGPDVIAIGTDYLGIEHTPEDLENITKVPKLLEELIKRGFSEDDIKKIAYENALRVIKINLT